MNQELFSAEIARKNVKNFREKTYRSLNEILSDIKHASENGNDIFTYREMISKVNLRILCRLGYTIENDNGYWSISW